MHSGTNPSPGLGIVRSLREFGDYHLVGVDYSPNSSGLHSALLDDHLLFPSWSEIELPVWFQQLKELSDTTYVSTLDMETRLIGRAGLDPSIFLSPRHLALTTVMKPPEAAAYHLGLHTVPWIRTHRADDEELETFLRDSNDGVWVKAQHYEAIHVWDLPSLLHAVDYVSDLWGKPVHAERHVPGQELGIAFVARDGVLIDAIEMEKTVLTAAGKTWAGRTTQLEGGALERLKAWVDIVQWHGAAELELIRTWDGAEYLMEINPRFPAWVHGATVAGWNLPASLVIGEPIQADNKRLGFTRVIEEIPFNEEIGAPRFPWPGRSAIPAASKHPSGMPATSKRYAEGVGNEDSDDSDVPRSTQVSD